MPILKSVYFCKYLFFRRELREAKSPELFFLKIVKLVFLSVFLLVEYSTLAGQQIVLALSE